MVQWRSCGAVLEHYPKTLQGFTYPIKHMCLLSKRNANKNAATWKVLEYIPDTSRWCPSFMLVWKPLESAWNEMMKPWLDSSKAQSAWRYIGQVLHFKHWENGQFAKLNNTKQSLLEDVHCMVFRSDSLNGHLNARHYKLWTRWGSSK